MEEAVDLSKDRIGNERMNKVFGISNIKGDTVVE